MEDSEIGRKQAFNRQYGDAYGYSGQIDELRSTEFAHVKGKLGRALVWNSFHSKRELL
jgi:hypothetical protein